MFPYIITNYTEVNMMPTQIEIQADTAKQLFTLAEVRQVSLDTLLRELLRQTAQTKEAPPRWRLSGSMQLLDDDLASGSRQIANSLQDSLRKTSENL
jgi:hypothetical protein